MCLFMGAGPEAFGTVQAWAAWQALHLAHLSLVWCPAGGKEKSREQKRSTGLLFGLITLEWIARGRTFSWYLNV
jgi:hypothetical protein